MSSFSKSPDTCPVDIAKTAEGYIKKRLSCADALQFAIHCLTCRPCAAAVEEADSFARDMRGAAQQFRVEARAINAQMRFFVTGYEPPRR